MSPAAANDAEPAARSAALRQAARRRPDAALPGDRAHVTQPQRDPAALDALVLQRLMAWLAAHRAAWNSQPTSFTVNLSIATLEDERFVQKLAAALNAHGIAADTLGFEITEALCAQRRAPGRALHHPVREGRRVGAIDDFSFDAQVLPLLRSKAVRAGEARCRADLLGTEGQALAGDGGRHACRPPRCSASTARRRRSTRRPRCSGSRRSAAISPRGARSRRVQSLESLGGSPPPAPAPAAG